MEGLLQTLLENTLVAAAIAVVATVILRLTRAVPLAHSLYVVALAKLVTPSLFGLPVFGSAEPAEPVEPVAVYVTTETLPAPAGRSADGLDRPAASPRNAERLDAAAVVFGAWGLGAMAVLLLARRRRRRFEALVTRADFAPARVASITRDLAREIGLRTPPEVRVVDVRLSPVVFRARRRAVVLLPRVAVRRLDDAELRAVLAHELCHLANLDHWTRVLESVVVVAHWWNPIAWWVRRALRDSEELRCDARALGVLESGSRHYGRSILKTVSYVDGDVSGLPLAVSALGGPGSLRKRLTMIAENKTDHRLSAFGRVAMTLGAAALLPLGLTAQESGTKNDSRTEKLEQIRALLRDLKKDIAAQAEERSGEAKEIEQKEAKAHRVLRVKKADGGEQDVLFVGEEAGEGGGVHVIRGIHGEDGGNVALRWVKKGEEGELHEIEVDEAGRVHPATGWFQVGRDDTEKGDPKHGVFFVRGQQGKGEPNGFVWKMDDGDGIKIDVEIEGLEGLEGLPGMIKKLVGEHGDAEHNVAIKVLGAEGGVDGFVQKILEAHGHGDQTKNVEGNAFVFRTDDFAAPLGQLPEHVKKLIQAHGDHANVEVKVLGADGQDLPASIKALIEKHAAASGGDADVKVIRRKVEKKVDADEGDDGGETEALRKQLQQLEKQMRALEKKLEQMRGKNA